MVGWVLGAAPTQPTITSRCHEVVPRNDVSEQKEVNCDYNDDYREAARMASRW